MQYRIPLAYWLVCPLLSLTSSNGHDVLTERNHIPVSENHHVPISSVLWKSMWIIVSNFVYYARKIAAAL